MESQLQCLQMFEDVRVEQHPPCGHGLCEAKSNLRPAENPRGPDNTSQRLCKRVKRASRFATDGIIFSDRTPHWKPMLSSANGSPTPRLFFGQSANFFAPRPCFTWASHPVTLAPGPPSSTRLRRTWPDFLRAGIFTAFTRNRAGPSDHVPLGRPSTTNWTSLSAVAVCQSRSSVSLRPLQQPLPSPSQAVSWVRVLTGCEPQNLIANLQPTHADQLSFTEKQFPYRLRRRAHQCCV